jgi:hypothetical protein
MRFEGATTRNGRAIAKTRRGVSPRRLLHTIINALTAVFIS